VTRRGGDADVGDIAQTPAGPPDEAAVLQALRAVIDPEIGLNIVDLGLIYDLGISAEGAVTIEMTLTTPGCPLQAVIDAAVHRTLEPVPGISKVDLDLVWMPPWTPEMITPEGRRALGWGDED